MAGESPPEISDLLSSPQVVATVHDRDGLEALRRLPLRDCADLLEFRLDALAAHVEALPGAMAECAALPAIITARHPAEGGVGNLSPDSRLNLLRRFAPGAGAVDIELRSLADFGRDAFAELKSERTLLIVSIHDFLKTPPKGELLAAIDSAIGAGADIVKIATHLENLRDLITLTEILAETPHHLISAMGMGAFGKVSRLLLAKAGSVLNYGYLSTPNAPGQWPARDLKRLIAEL